MGLHGSSTKLGKAIVAQGVTRNKKIPDQAHHLLSSNVVIKLDAEYYKKMPKGKKKKLAFAAGYQLNGANNGILLPTHFGHQKALDLQRHRGNHYKAYYTNVETLIRPIWKKFQGKNVCKEPDKSAFTLDLSGAEDDARGNISSNPPSWWLYEWSQPLYDGDYRDEGTGNLSRSRAAVIDQVAGMQWLKDKAGPTEPKRRHVKTKAGRNTVLVLNSKWYSDKAYPVPGSIYK